uniref:AVR-Pii protein n=3 Tax=Pyricularia oryzae TaxID=318829 RepID=C4B8B7_PYROR|nr:AvrPii [Pyricularia oryzae]QNS36460.1 AvrPii [Pyricularia oryzae]BAH59485.1 AVR-Pii [Pyricularia oryzae]BAW95054.1 Avr-Pii protein [Pyricularia oryzae]BAW95055.1 Avr-Pii protein [Pyricularia oryzae]
MQLSKITFAIALYAIGIAALPTPASLNGNTEVATISDVKLEARSDTTYHKCSKCGYGSDDSDAYFNHKCN